MATVVTGVVRGTITALDAGTKDFTISGFGTPVAAVFIVSGNATDGTEVSKPCISIGATDGTRQRVCAFGSKDATSGNERSWNFHSQNGVIAIPDQAGSDDGLYSFNSWITDGVRITRNHTPANTHRVTVWLINGTGVAARVDDQTSINPSGTATITSPGFPVDLVFCFGNKAYSSSPTWAAGAQTSLGFATRHGTIRNSSVTWKSADNVSTVDVQAYVSDSYCTASITSSTFTMEGRVSAFSATGFSVTNDDADNSIAGFAWLALQITDAQCWTGIDSTPTSTGNTSQTASALPAQTVFSLATAITATNTLKTDDSASSIGIGVAANLATPVDGCAAVRTKDADTVTFEGGGLSDSKVARILKGDATAALTADFNAWLSNGYSLNYTVVLGSAAKWPTLVISQPVLTGPASGSSTAAGTLAGIGNLTGEASGSSAAAGTGTGTGNETGTSPGTSTVAGTLSGIGNLVGNSSGSSAPSGTGTGTGNETGTSAGLSTVAGAISGIGDLVGTSAGQGTGSGTGSGTDDGSGTSAGLSTVAGTLAGIGDLSGNSSGSSTGAGSGTADGSEAGNSAGASAVSGAISGIGDLVGTSAGQGSASGTGTGSGDESGSSAGLSTVAGAISGIGDLAGSSNGSSDAEGFLGDSSTLSGLSHGSSDVAGTLSGIGDLAGNSSGSSDPQGSVGGDLPATGSASGTSVVAAAIVGIGNLAGSSNGSSAASGSFQADSDMTGVASGSSVAAGALSGIGDLSGSAFGSSIAQGTFFVLSPTCPIVGLAGWSVEQIASAGAQVVRLGSAGYDRVVDARASTC